MNDSLKLIFFILGRKMVHDPNGLAMGWQKGAPAYKKLHGILKSQHKIVLDTKRENNNWRISPGMSCHHPK